MQRKLVIFLITQCASIIGFAAPEATGAMTMENEYLKIAFDSETGGFSSIYNKRSNHEFIAAPDRSLLFRLMTPESGEDYRHWEGGKPDITVDGNRAILKFAANGMAAEAMIELQGDEIHARLRIHNDGPQIIEEVMFPWVRGVGQVEKGAFIWPQFWRRRYEDVFGKDFGGDHHTWNEGPQKLSARYPAHLASAWCDYGNDAYGLSLEARHDDFSITDFFAHKVVEKDRDPVRRTLDFVTIFPRRVKPGESYETPPAVISAHEGDWHQPAGRHRAYLESWILKPDRPAKFAEAIGWHFYFMKHQDGLVKNTYHDLPAMARAALEAGCRYLLLFGWQTGGHDNNYCYRYVPNDAWGGLETLREGIRQCKALGVEPIPFFNGTLANTEMPEHKEYGYQWEAKTRTGHPYYAGDWARQNFDVPSRNRSMLHVELSFCNEHQAFFISTAQRIAQEYGFGNLQLDQISEKMFVDYNEDHLVTTPDRVCVDGLSAMLPEVRKRVRAQNPEGVIVGEAINDFTGQWCDSSWDWNILLPFPEPIFYTLPWLMGSHEIDALEFGEVNKAFAYKLHLDMKIDGGDAPITKYPEFAAHVKSNAELRQRAAPYCVHADFVDQEGIECAAPAQVLVKTYYNKDTQKLGIIAAETEGKSAAFTVTITAPCGRNGRLESNKKAARDITLASPVPFELAPYEACVLCVNKVAALK